MECRLTVNGRETDAVFTDNNIEEILLPLLKKLSEIRREKGRRILCMLAAPPGAGKSTLALFLEKLSASAEGVSRVSAVGMDGFHYYARDLSEMTGYRDGKKVKLQEIKGAPETFDLPRLRESIGRLLAEPACSWPLYDRTVHDPVEGALLIRDDIIILEGNYLLLDAPGWRDLRGLADYTVRILAEEADVRERLVLRKAASGISREEAEHFAEFSDLYNVRTVMDHFLPADLTLRLQPGGSYAKEDRAI